VSEWCKTGIDVVVSLLTEAEVVEFHLETERELCEGHGIRFIAFPILDRGVPTSERAVDLTRDLDQSLTQGKTIALHCRQGIGRSALIAACLLAAAGEDVNTAFRRIGDARGFAVPDTVEQEHWVAEFAPDAPSRVAT
jgi:protein-tyrosine phosphatase